MIVSKQFKAFVKKILPAKFVNQVIILRRLLGNDQYRPVPFDNTYPWLNYTFLKLMKDSGCAQRQQYAWGVIQGAALAKVLGISRISVIELGVAGGCGLITLERIAENVEKE